jgi:hypothetical protein
MLATIFAMLFVAIFLGPIIMAHTHHLEMKRKVEEEKRKAEALNWRALALCVAALERFKRRDPADVIIEAVIITSTKPGPVPEQLKQLVEHQQPQLTSHSKKLVRRTNENPRLPRP